MDFNVSDKIFHLELKDRDPFYLDKNYVERHLNDIYKVLDPELRDIDYAPYPYFHPSKSDKTNSKFKSLNGMLHQIKMYWDEVTFESGLQNIITLIYINNDTHTYNRRVMVVSEQERRKAYESR